MGGLLCVVLGLVGLIGADGPQQPRDFGTQLVLEWDDTVPSIVSYQEIVDLCTRDLAGVADEQLGRQLRIRRADALHRLDRNIEAVAELQDLLDSNPDDPEVRWRLVRALFALPAERQRALDMAGVMVDGNTREGFPYALLGVAAVAQGQHERAISLLDRAIAYEPRHPVPYRWRAISHLTTGENEKAARDAQNALLLLPLAGELFSETPDKLGFEASAILTLALIELGLERDALRAAHRAMKLSSRSSQGFATLNIAFDAARLDASARRLGEEWLKRFPQDRMAHIYYSITMANRGELKEATSHAEQALALPVDVQQFWFVHDSTIKSRLAWYKALVGDVAKAETQLRGLIRQVESVRKGPLDEKLRLAFLLATSPNKLDRDGPAAMKLIQEIRAWPVLHRYSKTKLSVLEMVRATAAAECGDWEAASAACSNAITFVETRPEIRKPYEALQQRFRARQPARQPYRHYATNDERSKQNLVELRAGLIFY